MASIATLMEQLTAQVLDLPERQRLAVLRDLVVHFVEVSAYETGKLVGPAPAMRTFHAGMHIEKAMPSAASPEHAGSDDATAGDVDEWPRR